MTTINTSEDLLRLLREDAHFYEQCQCSRSLGHDIHGLQATPGA